MGFAERRATGGTGWNFWRTVVGAFYLLSAVFNAAYTLPLTDEPDTFQGYADGAWFSFLTEFMEDVFAPNGAVFMVIVVVFEVAVGLLIMGRGGWVDFGVAASLVWVIAILPFLAWPYLLVNVALVLIQGVILLRRYPTTIWHLMAQWFDARGTPHPG
jgi:hypothetical protein